MRAGGTVTQAGLALGGDRPTRGQARDNQQSTMRRGARILMGVHPGLRFGG
jgi:hypothetical protein